MVVPSIFTVSVSVNGVVTVPILIWKLSVAAPTGIVTLCPNVAVSAAGTPPNHAQLVPANGGAAPPPVPHPATLQSGVVKLVEVCTVHNGHGVPASNVPSAIRSLGVHVGVGDADGVPVGVVVGVLVGVLVGVFVGVGVIDGEPVGVFVGVFVGVGVAPAGHGKFVIVSILTPVAATRAARKVLAYTSMRQVVP